MTNQNTNKSYCVRCDQNVPTYLDGIDETPPHFGEENGGPEYHGVKCCAFCGSPTDRDHADNHPAVIERERRQCERDDLEENVLSAFGF